MNRTLKILKELLAALSADVEHMSREDLEKDLTDLSRLISDIETYTQHHRDGVCFCDFCEMLRAAEEEKT